MKTFLALIGAVILAAVILVAFSALISLPVWLLWNWLVPTILTLAWITTTAASGAGMTGKCFIIRVVGGGETFDKTWKRIGEYRILANTRETAEQRAQASFRHEFGGEGRIDYVEEV